MSLLETALTALLHPLAHEDILAWREAIRAPLMGLSGADVLGVHFPFLPAAAAWDTPYFTPQLLADFARSFQHADPVAQRVEAQRLELAGDGFAARDDAGAASGTHMLAATRLSAIGAYHLSRPAGGWRSASRPFWYICSVRWQRL